MKNILSILTLAVSVSAYAQTVTDSLSTSIGEFVIVSSEQIEEASAATEETSTTSDGGTAELVTSGTGGARLAPEQTIVSDGIAMQLTPNPASQVVEVKLTGITGPVSVTAVNVLGQVIYSANVNAENGKSVYLPAQQWGSGNYLIMINTGAQVLQEKLIVQ